MQTTFKTSLVALLVILCNRTFSQVVHEPQDNMGFILSGGYKHLELRHHNYNAATIDITLHNFFNDIDFNGSFYWGKDYISMEPFSLFGLLGYYFIKYGEGGYLNDDNMVALFVCGSALSSTSFNIRIGDNFNIRPYWSLLRLTKLKNEEGYDKFKLNGALGAYLTVELGRIMINPHGEWTFGWQKKSPFMGYAVGVSVGVKLYDS